MEYLNVNIQSTKTKYATNEILSQTLSRYCCLNSDCSLRPYGDHRILKLFIHRFYFIHGTEQIKFSRTGISTFNPLADLATPYE